jgi:hypothetical protein
MKLKDDISIMRLFEPLVGGADDDLKFFELLHLDLEKPTDCEIVVQKFLSSYFIAVDDAKLRSLLDCAEYLISISDSDFALGWYANLMPFNCPSSASQLLSKAIGAINAVMQERRTVATTTDIRSS